MQKKYFSCKKISLNDDLVQTVVRRKKRQQFVIYLEDPGEARGCFTNIILNKGLSPPHPHLVLTSRGFNKIAVLTKGR